MRVMSEGGPLALRVEGPRRAVGVLRGQGYTQCEVREITESSAEAAERPVTRLATKAAGPTPSSVALVKESGHGA